MIVFSRAIVSYALHEMDRVVCSCSFDCLLLFTMGDHFFKKYCSQRCGINRNKFWKTWLYSFCNEFLLCHFSFYSKTLGQASQSIDRCIEHSLGHKKLFYYIHVQGRRVPRKANWIMVSIACISSYAYSCTFPRCTIERRKERLRLRFNTTSSLKILNTSVLSYRVEIQ